MNRCVIDVEERGDRRREEKKKGEKAGTEQGGRRKLC